MDLIRRVEGVEAFALTSPLVMRSDGKKMGKSEKGALYLDPEMTSPYEFYQYWVNVPDADVEQFLMRFTFLPLPEIRELCAAKDEKINDGQAQARPGDHHPRARAATRRRKRRKHPAPPSSLAARMPIFPGCRPWRYPGREVEKGIGVVDLFVRSTLCATKSDARRLISQGGAYVGRRNVTDVEQVISADAAEDDVILLRAGKKRYFRILLG